MRDEEHIQRKVRITSIDFDELISHWDRCKRELEDRLKIPVEMIEEEVAGNQSFYRVHMESGIAEIEFTNCVFSRNIYWEKKHNFFFNKCEFKTEIKFRYVNFSFSGCTFNENFCFHGEFIENYLVKNNSFSECTFRKDVTIESSNKKHISLKDFFENCNFARKLTLSRLIVEDRVLTPNLGFKTRRSEVVFSECTFKHNFESGTLLKQTYEKNCVFEGDAVFKIKNCHNQFTFIENTSFRKIVTFDIGNENYNIQILDTSFAQRVNFDFNPKLEYKNTNMLNIMRCILEGEVLLTSQKRSNERNLVLIPNFKCIDNKFFNPVLSNHIEVMDFILKYNQFSDVVSFAHCCFHSIPEDGFAFNSFLSLVNFHQAELPKGFNLSDNLFKEGINFRGVTLTDDPKKHSLNQESCRIIKYSLDKIGNTVEANEYFALEMRNFSHSISLHKNPNKFVIWLSRISSNFGQSWFRPFALLMLTALGYHLGAVLPDIADEYQQTSTLTIQPLFTHNFLEGILPLKKLMGLGSTTYKIELTWANALTTLIQIYLIWQIILASKRQIKR